MRAFALAVGKPYIPGPGEILAFAGDWTLALTIVAILLTPFFTRRANVVCGVVALIGLSVAFGLTFSIGSPMHLHGAHFRGSLWMDALSVGYKGILLLFAIGIVLMRLGTGMGRMHEGDGPEFFCLLIGATLGMSIMASTTNLLIIFMAIELASFPSYVLAGFQKSSRLGAEASLKYVLFGAASSAVMLYGLSMFYGMYGTMNLDEIKPILNTTDALAWVSVLAMAVGVGFKIASVPFHFWCPDVFQGAAVDVSAFLSVASKSAALVLGFRIVGYVSGRVVPAEMVTYVVGSAAIATMTWGNLAAFVQTNVKRLLAYSSIAHAGYMLCALALTGVEHAGAALLYYIFMYAIMNLGAFVVVAIVESQASMKGAEAGATLEDFSGLFKRAPVLSVCLAVCLFSLVGLPPVSGFFAKLNLMLLLGKQGAWGWMMVASIGVNTILSLYVYMRWASAVYLKPGDATPLKRRLLANTIAVACALSLIALFVAYSPVWRVFSKAG